MASIEFIGIGAQKSGTSWLYQNLKLLPEFALLPIKELHYFDRSPVYPSSTVLMDASVLGKIRNPDWLLKFKNGFLRKKKLSHFKWHLKYFFSQVDNDWYLSLFDNCKGIKGEITPSYSILKISDIQNMYNLAPDAKLILLLRNPIYRAWSQYRHEWRRAKDYSTKKIDPKMAIKFLNSKTQILRSDYEQTINNFLSVYPSSQLLICFYDAIENNPKQLMESIVGFIGGNTAPISEYLDLTQKFNVNPKIEMPEEIFNYLKLKYKRPIERMALKYGGYFKVWQDEVYGSNQENKSIQNTTMIL